MSRRLSDICWRTTIPALYLAVYFLQNSHHCDTSSSHVPLLSTTTRKEVFPVHLPSGNDSVWRLLPSWTHQATKSHCASADHRRCYTKTRDIECGCHPHIAVAHSKGNPCRSPWRRNVLSAILFQEFYLMCHCQHQILHLMRKDIQWIFHKGHLWQGALHSFLFVPANTGTFATKEKWIPVHHFHRISNYPLHQ